MINTTTEYLHTCSRNPELFYNHAEDYLRGIRTVPVIQITTHQGAQVLCTFSDDLMRDMVDGDRMARKGYETATRYGFRGYSQGGRNGIFYLRRNDGRLISGVHTLVDRHIDEIKSDFELSEYSLEDITQLKSVKLVFHRTDSKRIVGCYSEQRNRIMLLGTCRY